MTKFLHKPVSKHHQKSSMTNGLVGDGFSAKQSHIGMQAFSQLSDSKDPSRISSVKRKKEALDALENYVRAEEHNEEEVVQQQHDTQ